MFDLLLLFYPGITDSSSWAVLARRMRGKTSSVLTTGRYTGCGADSSPTQPRASLPSSNYSYGNDPQEVPLALSIAPGTRSRTCIFDSCAERAQVHFASVGDVQAGYGVLDGLSQGSGHEQAWTSSHDCELEVFRHLSPPLYFIHLPWRPVRRKHADCGDRNRASLLHACLRAVRQLLCCLIEPDGEWNPGLQQLGRVADLKRHIPASAGSAKAPCDRVR